MRGRFSYFVDGIKKTKDYKRFQKKWKISRPIHPAKTNLNKYRKNNPSLNLLL
jgi:hypothetical protein